MSEIGMPMLVARRRLPMDIDALMDMRLLRASGSEGQTRVQPLPDEEDPHFRGLRELARRKHGKPGALFHRSCWLACRELVRWEGLEALPAEVGKERKLGVGALALDMLLRNQGLELGGTYRGRILRELADAGILESSRNDRWYAYKPEAPELTDQEEQLRSRLLFLSNLNLTVIQRFQGSPGHLIFMGFISTEAERRELGARLNAGMWEKIQSLRQPLWKVKLNARLSLNSAGGRHITRLRPSHTNFRRPAR